MDNPYAPPEVDSPPQPSESGGLLLRIFARLELFIGALVCLLGAVVLGLLGTSGLREPRNYFSAGVVFTIGALIIWAAWCLARRRYLPQLVLLLLPAIPAAIAALD